MGFEICATVLASTIAVFGTDSAGIICGDISKGYAMQWPSGGWRPDEPLPRCLVGSDDGQDPPMIVVEHSRLTFMSGSKSKQTGWFCING